MVKSRKGLVTKGLQRTVSYLVQRLSLLLSVYTEPWKSEILLSCWVCWSYYYNANDWSENHSPSPVTMQWKCFFNSRSRTSSKQAHLRTRFLLGTPAGLFFGSPPERPWGFLINKLEEYYFKPLWLRLSLAQSRVQAGSRWGELNSMNYWSIENKNTLGKNTEEKAQWLNNESVFWI